MLLAINASRHRFTFVQNFVALHHMYVFPLPLSPSVGLLLLVWCNVDWAQLYHEAFPSNFDFRHVCLLCQPMHRIDNFITNLMLHFVNSAIYGWSFVIIIVARDSEEHIHLFHRLGAPRWLLCLSLIWMCNLGLFHGNHETELWVFWGLIKHCGEWNENLYWSMTPISHSFEPLNGNWWQSRFLVIVASLNHFCIAQMAWCLYRRKQASVMKYYFCILQCIRFTN